MCAPHQGARAVARVVIRLSVAAIWFCSTRLLIIRRESTILLSSPVDIHLHVRVALHRGPRGHMPSRPLADEAQLLGVARRLQHRERSLLKAALECCARSIWPVLPPRLAA